MVTGANGHLATNIIKYLILEGYNVRGVLRHKNSYKGIMDKRLELVEGDFTNLDFVKQVISGCDFVIHVAAITAPDLLKYSDYYAVNVKSVNNLLELSIHLGVKRFVFVSTANVFGYGSRACPGNEDLPFSKLFSGSLYARSKYEAQKIALAYSDKIDVIVINPTFMIGPYGSTNGSNRITYRAKGKKIILVPPGGKSFVSVCEVAKGTISALKKGQNGEAYLLSGRNMTYLEFYQQIRKVTGTKQIFFVIPSPILILAGASGSLLRLLGIKCALSITNARILCINNFYSNRKAICELGLTKKGLCCIFTKENTIS